MALIDAVKATVGRLASKGWRELLAKHGLDITAPDLAAELARPLTVDRTIPGFGDFCLAGTRAIEPGSPAASLLYHALASPNVHPTPTGDIATDDSYPTFSDLDGIENYIYSLKPFDPALKQNKDAVVAVFAYQYRPAQSSVHGYHADLAFSRTGVGRVGTATALWNGSCRNFRADPPDGNGIAVSPARYAAFLAVSKRPKSADPIMGRRDQDDRLREFYFPVQKLFDGKDCVVGATIKVKFQEYHRNDKLRRIHKSGGVKVVKGFKVDDLPFMRDSENGGDLVTLQREGASVLVVPRPQSALVRTVKQMNTVSNKNEIVRFIVPPSSSHERFESSLKIADRRTARVAPEYVNIRHRVVSKGAGHALEDLQTLPPADFDSLVMKKGNYEAAHFVDDSCDGALIAVVQGLTKEHKNLAAYSLVTAPDFFPLSDQIEVTNWVRHDFQTNQEHFASGAPWPLCEGRRAANLELPRPDAPSSKAFKRTDQTIAAVVGVKPLSTEQPAPGRKKRFASFLPDAASNVFAPGWDISLGTNGEDIYYALYGLGSPFPEDAKLCAALNSFWPAVAPDASRTFRYQNSPTAIPLLDRELGYHPEHSKVKAGTTPATLGWDGEQGPFLEPFAGKEYVNFADISRSDYVSNSLRNTISLRLTALVDSEEMINRMEALKRCIRALPPRNDRVNGTNLWLVTAEDIADWSQEASRANAQLTGAGFLYLFVLPDEDGEGAMPTDTPTRQRIRVKNKFECQIAKDKLFWRQDNGAWRSAG